MPVKIEFHADQRFALQLKQMNPFSTNTPRKHITVDRTRSPAPSAPDAQQQPEGPQQVSQPVDHEAGQPSSLHR